MTCPEIGFADRQNSKSLHLSETDTLNTRISHFGVGIDYVPQARDALTMSTLGEEIKRVADDNSSGKEGWTKTKSKQNLLLFISKMCSLFVNLFM